MIINKKGKRYALYFLFVFGLMEIVARYGLGLGDPPLSLAHPTIEYMFKPDQNVFRFHNKFMTNNFGMRSSYFTAEKQRKNEFRIMMFGDSVLNGGSLTDHNDLGTTLLQKRLQDELNKDVIVGNISAGSWGPGNWLGYVKQFGLFDADIIVIVLSGHDIADNPSFYPLSPKTHPTKKPFLALVEGITRYCPRYLSQDANADNNKKLSQFEIEKGMAFFDEFLGLTKTAAEKVIVVYHPEKNELNEGINHQGRNYIDKVVRKNGLQLHDLSNAYMQSINSGSNVFRDKIHLNKIGQRIVSKYILKIIN